MLLSVGLGLGDMMGTDEGPKRAKQGGKNFPVLRALPATQPPTYLDCRIDTQPMVGSWGQ